MHSQPPCVSRLAVLDRRLPCFHLLAAQGPAGCGCHGGVGKAGTRGRVSGVWIVPAGWLRARPPNGRRAIRVGLAGWYGSPEAGSCAAYPSRGSGPLDASLHPAPSNGRRRTTEHPPRSTEPPRSRGARGRAMLSDPANAVGEDSRPSPDRSSHIMHDGRSRPPTAPAARGRGAASRRNATWLILPVVICLSQRLSHACVSMN